MESNRIEYKQKLTDQLEKEVVAFLNYTGGGIIYLGIGKNGEVVGIDEADQVQLQIKDRLKNNIVPSCLGLYDVVKETREGKDLIKVIVASGQERPYYIKKYGLSEKGAFIRVGSASYGGLPLGISEDEFFEGISIPRSKEIMRIFRDMELVEQLGLGIPRILRSYDRSCFKFSDNYIRMSFPSEQLIQPTEKENIYINEGLKVEENGGVNGGVNGVENLIEKHPGITTKEIKDILQISQRTTERWLKQLREQGKIEFRGAPKTGGYWKINKDG